MRAALDLFAAHGYPQVTMEQVAEAAGVSRSTVYRRFPTKDHVVRAVVEGWLDVWDAARAAQPDDAPAREIVGACCRAVAAHVDATAQDVLTAYAALATSPSLALASLSAPDWHGRVVAILREDQLLCEALRHHGDVETGLHVLAGAHLGAIDAVMDRWVAGRGEGGVGNAIEAMLGVLAPVWPDTQGGP